ncbi:nucleotide sugar dehydrogenase [Flavihumibacter rivuli]|uniref:nucleotide sugar dehydrogenase n=1 Tax=Flavihumibacter rivuli TaxID=2838156 RepID=UPI001BDE4373|nr:nucleotide sugar dehydrogenase [Flavihumibacter rivuli]ULQ58173.1 nucleotide sugar dehydrogenase [Flavihumibacter rivuli]
MGVYQDLVTGASRLAVIGLGYVGLPLLEEFAKHINVVGFDIDGRKVKEAESYLANRFRHIENESVKEIMLTSELSGVKGVSFYVITVPTPVDKYKVPDIGHLLDASSKVGGLLKKGDYVVYESTTYPGCTEDECIPVLEANSGLKAGVDFKVGYSPERINPGDQLHGIRNVVKVVAGLDQQSLDEISEVYSLIVEAGIFKAASIKVAEASKIVENTQRDINIALMNELSGIFDLIGINTYDVLEAAATKWNFLPFKPGLVGGHCISVDPYYLNYKASSLGYHAKLIAASRLVNDEMALQLARKIIRYILPLSADPKVLVKGVTFKENVGDIRNSKIIDTVKELQSYNIRVDLEDPYADRWKVRQEYGMDLVETPAKGYDAVVITVPHHPYIDLDDAYFAAISSEHAVIVDLKGIYRKRIHSRTYWSL